MSATNMDQKKPVYVTNLEAAYGAPSQAGFGSAVFYEPMADDMSLAQMALDKYRYFVGDLWEQYGAQTWMVPWKEVYSRPSAPQADIVAELRAIADPYVALSAPMLLDNIEDAQAACTALSAAYDDPVVTELRVFNLGDSAALSGLLIAGRRQATGDALFLVFLMD